MVCEICGSQSIRKENGIFICQECGTEYSLEEAKNLLQEVGESQQVIQTSNCQNEKDNLTSYLSSWALLISKIPDVKNWFNIDEDINSETFWLVKLNEISNKQIKSSFSKISFDFLYNDDYDKNRSLSKNICQQFYKKDMTLGDYLESLVSNSSEYKSFMYLFRYVLYIAPEGTKRPDTVFQYTFDSKGQRNILKAAYIQNETRNHCLYSSTKSIWTNITKYYLVEGDTRFYQSFLKNSSSTVSEFIDKHNQLMMVMEENYDFVCESCKEIQEGCLQLEKDFYLPYKYRSVPIILEMIDLLKDGKASTWKELVNLYDENQFRLGVYEKLDVINAKLDSIHNSMISGFIMLAEGINSLGNRIDAISDKISAIDSKIKDIRKHSFITMWESLDV